MKRPRADRVRKSPRRARPRVIDSPWEIQRPKEASRRSRVHARILKALKAADRLGVPFESVYREPTPRKDRPERVLFRHGPTGKVLLLDREAGSWTYEWEGVRRALNHWTDLRTADGERWIVKSPRSRPGGGRDVPYPYRPHPGLKKILFDGWYQSMSLGSRPECADQRSHAIKAAQIIKALAEAAERGGTAGEKLIDTLEIAAGRYLKSLKFKKHPSHLPGHGQGLKLVLDRPSALHGLAQGLLRQLPPDDEPDSAFAVAAGFVRTLREGSSYAKVAAELPDLAHAGDVETNHIAALYVAASNDLRAKRRSLLCEKCAPGIGGLGPLGQRGSHYASPIPGDREGWGCRGTTPTGTICGPLAESSINRERWEIAKNLLCGAVAILGFPSTKARHLFSFEDKRTKRQRPHAVAARPLAET
jgi:hypothetical protein